MVAEPIFFSNLGDFMKFAAPLFLLTACAVLSGCTKLKVTAEQNAAFDYTTVATYQWTPAADPILQEDDTYLNENIQIALNNQLSGRGWNQVMEAAEADLQVVYYIKLAEQEEYAGGAMENDNHPVAGGVTFKKDSSWSYKEAEPDLSVYTIEIGTLYLLIHDAETGEKIWTGTLETRLDRTTPLVQQPELLAKIAKRIVRKIPAN
jgi:hypothetical protein